MSSISARAAAAREQARRADGKFGSYQLGDAGTEASLDMGASAPVVTDRPQWVVADPCPEGYIDLYHRTNPQAAEAIYAGDGMHSKENTDEAYFSTRPDSEETSGYGEAVVMIRVREDDIEIEDEFPDGEEHYRVRLSAITAESLMSQCGTCGKWDFSKHDCPNAAVERVPAADQASQTSGAAESTDVRSGYVTDEWDRWQQGECGTYAMALIRENPGLRFGTIYDGDGVETHHFAHDDEYAYDSVGRHRLPYTGIAGGQSGHECALDEDPFWYSLDARYDFLRTDELAEAAAHAHRHDIMNRPLIGEVPVSTDFGHALAKAAPEPMTILTAHRRTSLSTHAPADPSAFDRDVEPAGRYVIEVTGDGSHLDPHEWEMSEVTFTRPLHIERGDYGTSESWKRRLSEHYGLTGAELSSAIAAEFDAIITSDKYGNDEIIDLTTRHRLIAHNQAYAEQEKALQQARRTERAAQRVPANRGKTPTYGRVTRAPGGPLVGANLMDAFTFEAGDLDGDVLKAEDKTTGEVFWQARILNRGDKLGVGLSAIALGERSKSRVTAVRFAISAFEQQEH